MAIRYTVTNIAACPFFDVELAGDVGQCEGHHRGVQWNERRRDADPDDRAPTRRRDFDLLHPITVTSPVVESTRN